MYYFQKNVYLVEGYVNGAIYDLNRGEVFQISSQAKELLSNIRFKENYNSIELDFLNKLVNENLLSVEYVEEHMITDLIEEPKIEFVWIEVTDVCNLKCIHCYDNAVCGNGNTMSLEDFIHIIDELVVFGITKIQLIGGEPLVLNEKLYEYLDYCIGKFEYIEIFTNGTLLTKKHCEYFKKNKIRIALSVYSYNEEMHNSVTQNVHSWKKTNDAIQMLHDYGIVYRVKNVIMNNVSISEKNTDLYTLSERKDIVRLTGRAKLNLLNDELIQKKLITEESVVSSINRTFIKRCISGHNCFSRRLYFSVDLSVYPCVMERRLCHGNLRHNSIQDILQKNILKFNKDRISECRDCEFRYCCFDCRPDSDGNSIYDKPWFCTYYPLEGIWEDDISLFIRKLKQKRN